MHERRRIAWLQARIICLNKIHWPKLGQRHWQLSNEIIHCRQQNGSWVCNLYVLQPDNTSKSSGSWQLEKEIAVNCANLYRCSVALGSFSVRNYMQNPGCMNQRFLSLDRKCTPPDVHLTSLCNTTRVSKLYHWKCQDAVSLLLRANACLSPTAVVKRTEHAWWVNIHVNPSL